MSSKQTLSPKLKFFSHAFYNFSLTKHKVKPFLVHVLIKFLTLSEFS